MARRKGELTPGQLDRQWPYQVATLQSAYAAWAWSLWPADPDHLFNYAPRGHSVVLEGEWWTVHCFADPEERERFKIVAGGVDFDPRDRGRGHDWSRWTPGAAAERDRLRRMKL